MIVRMMEAFLQPSTRTAPEILPASRTAPEEEEEEGEDPGAEAEVELNKRLPANMPVYDATPCLHAIMTRACRGAVCQGPSWLPFMSGN